MAHSDEDEDQTYQQQFIRSLFATANNDDFDEVDAGESDDDAAISEHTWLTGRPNDDSATAIIYHLAFLAPGHGDSVWNASECIAEHLLFTDLRSMIFGDALEGRSNWPPSRCVEFGAGAALPSLVLLHEGAGRVVVTDRYVNQQTFDALRMSVDKNAKLWGMTKEEVEERVAIVPHTWGEDVERLAQTKEGGDANVACERADLLIASDCIYNPTYHGALLQSAVGAMDKDGVFVVGYSFHGNVPPSRTLNFFAVAREEFGLRVVREFTKGYEGQRGIGSLDEKRGVVYVKVLAREGSVHFVDNVA